MIIIPYLPSGNVNAGLVYDEGEITLTYNEGEPCHSGKFKRKTIITFSCDQSVTGRDGPHFINETSDCIYQFIWPTRYACPPFRTGECTAQDSVSGKTFDLSTLAMTDNNYEYIDYTKKKKYIFNVCRSLVHKKGKKKLLYYLKPMICYSTSTDTQINCKSNFLFCCE